MTQQAPPVGMQRFERKAKRAIRRKEIHCDYKEKALEALDRIKGGHSINGANASSSVNMERFLSTLAGLIEKDPDAPKIEGVLLAEKEGLLTFSNKARLGFVIEGLAHVPIKEKPLIWMPS